MQEHTRCKKSGGHQFLLDTSTGDHKCAKLHVNSSNSCWDMSVLTNIPARRTNNNSKGILYLDIFSYPPLQAWFTPWMHKKLQYSQWVHEEVLRKKVYHGSTLMHSFHINIGARSSLRQCFTAPCSNWHDILSARGIARGKKITKTKERHFKWCAMESEAR